MILLLAFAAVAILVLAVFWNMPAPSWHNGMGMHLVNSSGLTEESERRFQEKIPPNHELVQHAREFGRMQEERKRSSLKLAAD